MNLLSTQTLVESPFIILTVGNYTFGNYTKVKTYKDAQAQYNITFPNYMKSIEITKVNGQVNIYTISIEYRIAAGDDPNLLDRVFGSISNIGAKSRKVTISYGDWSSPTFRYREETALITTLTSSIDYSGSCITYTLKCTSDVMPATSTLYEFPKREAKPSDIIKEILYNKSYGLTDVFYGMTNASKVQEKNLIASCDQKVEIPAVKDMNILSYLNFLVNNMVNIGDNKNDLLRNHKYSLVIVDDVKGEMEGPYFKVIKTPAKIKTMNSLDVYDIDIGYPGDNFVTGFSLKDDQSWALLYQHSTEIPMEKYVQRIDNSGNIYETVSPSIMRHSSLYNTTELDKTWWTNMTQFPVSATLVIKGLLRPAVLMTNVNLNVYFYGQKHVSSGVYTITKQVDRIDASGYRTTLSLLRLSDSEALYFNNIVEEF